MGLAISQWFLTCLAADDWVRVPARAVHVSKLAVLAIFTVACKPVEFAANLAAARDYSLLHSRTACWACLEHVVSTLIV